MKNISPKQEWEHFINTAYRSIDISEQQYDEIKMVFYSGMFVLSAYFKEISQSEEVRTLVIEKFYQETRLFLRDYIAKRTK